MKKISILLATVLLLISSTTNAIAADAGNFGLGVILGEPSGLTAKYRVSPKNAFDAGLAFSFNSFVMVYGDYLWQFRGAFAGKSGERFVRELTPYVGAGLSLFMASAGGNRFYTGTSTAGLGIRIPLGIEWTPAEPPLGVFVELVPGLGIVPSTFGFFQGGAGVRYYF